MEDPIKNIQRQTLRYWYVDGLTEMGGGSLIFILGLTFLIAGLIGPGEASDWLTSLGQPILMLIGYVVINWAVRRLKERITYPRTGYVAFRREKGKRRVWAVVLAMALSTVFAIAAVSAGHLAGEQLLPAIVGLLLCLATAYLGYNFGLRRFYLLAVFTLILGVLGSWLNLLPNFASGLFFGGLGLGWVVSGAWTLADYLRKTTLEEISE